MPRGQNASTSCEITSAQGYTPIDNALRLTLQKQKVAAVLICSTSQVGGEYVYGFSDPFEGDLCMRSDLYHYLVEARHQARHSNYTDWRGAACHIPEDGSTCMRHI